MVPFWFVYRVFMVRFRCVLCLWCVYGAFMVRLWCVYGVFMVRLWCVYGAFMVSFLCVFGAFLALLWSICAPLLAGAPVRKTPEKAPKTHHGRTP